ncbi:hypothetical protein PVK06_000481 [Gossypium arboreum]|uniref:Leucine-rich repeat-containing N-terminal plant-type domain-containing protein n=1 Tax=Gossypium arboreum TaxID=29729 RepID=A0ABR0QYH1_GOSAR|nr:hypothetical protein PVK06_000481 [Gossypium arboreum]
MGNTFLNLALLIIFQFSIRPTFSMKLTTILTDQSALLALKNHVYDPENVLETNWSSSTHVCNWFRVSCGSRHHRVTALNLSGLGLVGTLPPSLGNLSFLSLLSITNNSFHGRLPVQLSNLRRLKHLSFGNNSFSGEIPSWLGSLTELRSLFLNHNNLNGVIPFSLSNLSKLEILTLSRNQLFDSIPSSIFNISSLQKMDLSNNMLSGSIPPVSRDLLSIELINFNINNLTGHLSKDMFDHFPNLKELHLSANMLSGRIPMSLFKCKKLQMFSLSYNQLEGSLPVEIGNLSMLQRVYIARNHFEGEIPRQIVNLTLLSVLDFPDNNFTEYGIEGIVSTKGDVYSFGILMIETITRKKPTDKMFAGEQSLKIWVKESISSPLNQVVDTNLLCTIGSERSAANNCVLSILHVGLECSLELPNERPNMKEIVTKLNKIKVRFLEDIEGGNKECIC